MVLKLRSSLWGKALLAGLALSGGYCLGYRHAVSVFGKDSMNGPAVIRQEVTTPRTENRTLPQRPLAGEKSSVGKPDSGKSSVASAEGVASTTPSKGHLIITAAQLKEIEEIEKMSETPGLSRNEALGTEVPLLKEGSDLDARELPRTDELRQKCREGKWEEVVAMAQDRLSKNPKDIPALLIYAQHYAEMADPENHLATVKKIIQAVKEANTPMLSTVRAGLMCDLAMQCRRWESVTAERVAEAKQQRATRKGRPLFNVFYFRVCEADGLF